MPRIHGCRWKKGFSLTLRYVSRLLNVGIEHMKSVLEEGVTKKVPTKTKINMMSFLRIAVLQTSWVSMMLTMTLKNFVWLYFVRTPR